MPGATTDTSFAALLCPFLDTSAAEFHIAAASHMRVPGITPRAFVLSCVLLVVLCYMACGVEDKVQHFTIHASSPF